MTCSLYEMHEWTEMDYHFSEKGGCISSANSLNSFVENKDSFVENKEPIQMIVVS